MSQGRFVWYDLATTDLPGAQRFYGAVVGWRIRDAGHPSVPYTLLESPAVTSGNASCAGMMALTPEMRDAGARPHWGGYIAVPDVDVATQRLQRLGGAVHRPPADIPEIGRFSVVADPQGASFYLFTPSGSGEMPDERAQGMVAWRELHSTDPQAGFAFYSELLGWRPGQAMDMGPFGTYQLFSSDSGQRGGIMRAMGGAPSAWLYYFSVPSVAAAAAAAVREGGQQLGEVHQEPEGGWICRLRDPEGVQLAVVGPR